MVESNEDNDNDSREGGGAHGTRTKDIMMSPGRGESDGGQDPPRLVQSLPDFGHRNNSTHSFSVQSGSCWSLSLD